MEDKRTALAIFLSIMVVMIYSELFIAPYTRPTANQEGSVAAGGEAASDVQPGSNGEGESKAEAVSPALEPSQAAPSFVDISASAKTRIETSLFTAEIVHLGGRLSSFKLKRYKKELGNKEPLDLIVKSESATLPLGAVFGGFSDALVEYRVEGDLGPKVRVKKGEKKSLKLVGQLPNGNSITKTLMFDGGSYFWDVSVGIDGGADVLPRVWLEWTQFEPEMKSPRVGFAGIMYLSENKVSHYKLEDLTDSSSDLGISKWVGFTDKYFLSSLIPAGDAVVNSRVAKSGQLAIFEVAGQAGKGNFSVYVGPKDYALLRKSGHELYRSVDLGWFAFLAHPLLWLIRAFYKIFGNYGVSIVLLTLLIKLLFLPLTKVSLQSMQAMQEIQPEIKALRERVKDATQLNQELMALYKRKGVNPMGGCLPILIQLPVFLGLYNALLYSIELRHAPFALWIRDLSAPESLHVLGIGVPVMVLLMGLSMFVQQWMSPSTGDPTQRKIMMIMPIIFTFFFMGFPAGLVLYWLVNNVVSIVQQFHIRHQRTLSAGHATVLASVLIFGLSFILTLI